MLFEKLLDRQVRSATHDQLCRWRKRIREEERERFHSGMPARVEVCKAFSDDLYRRFMDHVAERSDEDHALYTVMTCLGLRYNEASRLTGRNVSGNTIRVPDSKGGFAGFLRLPRPLLSLIPAVDPHEFLFLGSNRWGKARKSLDSAIAELGKRFRRYRELAGLNDVYMHSKACGHAMIEQPRYVFSLHSFRHTGIQRFFRLCGSVEHTRRFARHTKIETTLRYLRKMMKGEVDDILARMPLADRNLPDPGEPVLAIKPRYQLMP